jgi:hypothetical protein
MSTKYYGYRLMDTRLEDVLYFLRDNYELFDKVFREQIKKNFVKYFYKSVDDALINPKKCKVLDMFSIANNYHQKVFNEKLVNRVYVLDIGLFPYGKDVLIMNNSDYIYEDIITSFGWEDFSYWNNSDKPDNITEEEWIERCNIWDTVCGDNVRRCSLRYNPCFNSIENYSFLWKYKELREYFEKYNPDNRMKQYKKDYEFANEYFKVKKDFKFDGVGVEDLLYITENNFGEKFEVILPNDFFF